MIKISLILPVYKVEKYISKCIDSCLAQDIPENEYEIIVVNDGSPDNCENIVLDYQKKHSNIKLINQINKGLSGARNTGLKNATGKYVWFIDSDDWIANNILGNIIKTIDNSSLDMMWLNWNRIDESGEFLNQFKDFRRSDNTNIMSGGEFMEEVLLFCTFAWSFIFNRDFLLNSGHLFKEGITFEDVEFIPRVLIEVNKIKYYDVKVYNYLWRESSITSINNPQKIDDLTIAIKTNSDLARKHQGVSYFNAVRDYLVLMVIRMLSDKNNREKRGFFLNFLKTNQITKMYYVATGIRRVMVFLFNISPKLCINISSLIPRR